MQENAIFQKYKTKSKVQTDYRGLSFESDGFIMKMNLPSGRCISYFEPRLIINKFDSTAIAYKNIDQETKKWCDTETYGGKLVENAVQAISRDILVHSMTNLRDNGFEICSHVHDEVITEVPENEGEQHLEKMESIMKREISWADELILGAAGYVTKYYKKD
jgi:DNA polymerase